MTDVLGVFAKWPEPGRAKTRLADATSPEFAARAADAMLRDTLDRLVDVPAERWLAFAPADQAAAFRDLAANRYRLIPQGDGDLGARMERFIRDRIDGGAERVVLVGADSPTLPVEHVHDAFHRLHDVDLVLGPATDGGYCVIGCRRRVPPVFRGVAWGTSTVLRDTVARLDDSWRLALLPPWYDVDTLDDWRMLQGHVAAMRRTGAEPRCPHVERLA
ncbi:MAG: TIGR04282 family arsenosugar biosynthesis glycosyltransferase [Gemmataceae bacterium]|nr:TIGR04282 family arsenosugar biosynthesis glycosyltransferase [Gemmataceae bacterium]